MPTNNPFFQQLIGNSHFIFPSQVATIIQCPNVYVSSFQFKTPLFSQSEAEKLGVKIPSSISNAVPKRLAEFVAGRFCARVCLDFHGLPEQQIAIGKNREPVWPEGIVASITHTNEHALCVSASSEQYIGIGLDIENILDAQLAKNLQGQIISDEEIKHCQKYTLDHAYFTTLAFSAKESLFKALHKQVGRYFGFDAAHIGEIDKERGTLTLTITQELTADIGPGKRYTCSFWQWQSTLITLLAIPIEQPVN